MDAFFGWLLASIPALPLVWVGGGAAIALVLTAALLSSVGLLASQWDPGRRGTAAPEKFPFDLPPSVAADSRLPSAA
jgi:hypothetical protein